PRPRRRLRAGGGAPLRSIVQHCTGREQSTLRNPVRALGCGISPLSQAALIRPESCKMTTCGEALIGILEQYGIDTIFGIPGGHTVELYRGLGNSKIRHVTPRHEQGAGFMADGFARASGRPAACFIITGPGLTNIATALGQAYGDSVPMLVISS